MTQQIALYQTLCALYYDLDKPTAPSDALRFFMQYAHQADGPILEPMCGTGRFLLPLLQAGFDIEGFDASDAMLAFLYQKDNHPIFKARVQNALLHDFIPAHQYKLIFIPDGSLNLFIDEQQAYTALQKLYDWLLPGGTLVLEIITNATIGHCTNSWTGDVQFITDHEYIMLSRLVLPVENNIGTTICRYDLVNNMHIVQTEMENFKIRLYDQQIFTQLLHSVGFTNIKRLKVYDSQKEAKPTDRLVIFECTK